MRLSERLFPINRWTLLLLGVVALLPAVLMWHLISTHWVALPLWDEWHTPGKQFASWCRGTLTLGELFSLHNEARKFFPRLLYFALAFSGGWDVREEMRVLFLLVCALASLLFHLVRRTPGATPLATLVGWSAMMWLCFAPVQTENFLYGIQLETFFPGVAVLAAAAVNLSRWALRTRALLNIALAFIATYTFANGMLLWLLAWPLASPNENMNVRQRRSWSFLYGVTGALSIGAYFVGYERPASHPDWINPFSRALDCLHYFLLWEGSYLSSAMAPPIVLGIFALTLLAGGVFVALRSIYRTRDWRPYYPWLLLAGYAVLSGLITALGRIGFGFEYASSTRYAAFTLYFYLALVGLYFAIYCRHVCSATMAARQFFLASTAVLAGAAMMCWILSLEVSLTNVAQERTLHKRLLRAFEWMEPIPDNPDLALIFPFVGVLRERADLLEKHRWLRLPFVHGRLTSAVRRSPGVADGRHGRLEVSNFDSEGSLFVKGWAWLPEQNRHADCVVIGCESRDGTFKPMSVLDVGMKRPDLPGATLGRPFFKVGFGRTINAANVLPGPITIKGWAIDLRAQTAWPLAGVAP